MKFYSAFNAAPSISEPKCRLELQDYVYNSKTGKLEPTKKIPFYKEIQSYAESTKLSTKLTAYSMGDFTALGFESDSYFDISGQDTNLANVLNINQVAAQEFERLPNELKQLFNGSFAEFTKCVNNNTLEQRLANYIRGKSSNGKSPTNSTNSDDKGV